ncbi:MAG: hypothetical protein A2315_13550 [Ignavibacteria bacterium RIFOXYB2_FULL_35_12]|nr:MAG: hypothetical protein A2058_09195 [Ignavibacteria bacterium GWA2_36_19]OGU61993.1 MAG: hypothetical protein A2X60_03480 [Ignavibacteria bacterium GWF2_35_20]OGU78663.1 MAG: hypothetical protein A2254_00610 [Ignavibacteria bacterium RIFOXYA2_FULL_35_9]OGU87330.1 MAG: hypothetical protein A2492_00455 [Ignavibacteria bacterium RIFOXYC12_FULL_35_11]OGU89798.1 MAG: hypothetical protein A3K31_13150 [Ignavibacteria bacterium RIFOXYA12_FULL_35_25]OGU95321.1 MAG: hypothetical protein A2347_09685
MISTSTKNIYSVVDIKMKVPFSYKQVLSCKALKFIADLHLNFNNRRLELLSIRNEKHNHTANEITFLSNMNGFKDRELKILGVDENDLLNQSLITDDKLIVIDFRTSNTPSWSSLVETQINLKEIIDTNHNNTLTEGEQTVDTAVRQISIVVCGRDLYADELNFYIDRAPLGAAFFDFGLYLFHNAKSIVESGSTPFIFIPNIDNYYEAKLWNEFLNYVEQELELVSGTIKVIVSLNYTLPAFEKKHIHEELSEHLVN